jgi:hypothetical protein
MSRRLIILRVSTEALAALFSLDGSRKIRLEGMPADAKIVGVSGDAGFYSDIIAFKVESQEFPEIEPFAAIPYMELKVREEYDAPPESPSLLRFREFL